MDRCLASLMGMQSSNLRFKATLVSGGTFQPAPYNFTLSLMALARIDAEPILDGPDGIAAVEKQVREEAAYAYWSAGKKVFGDGDAPAWLSRDYAAWEGELSTHFRGMRRAMEKNDRAAFDAILRNVLSLADAVFPKSGGMSYANRFI